MIEHNATIQKYQEELIFNKNVIIILTFQMFIYSNSLYFELLFKSMIECKHKIKELIEKK